MAKGKKLFYTPGIVSLLAVPVIFVWYARQYLESNPRNVISLNAPSEEFIKSNAALFPLIESGYPPNRNYREIAISGNMAGDNRQLDSARLYIHNIITTQEFEAGMHFKFGPDSRYRDLINALNILMAEDAKVYLLNRNDLWFYLPKPPVSSGKTIMISDCLLCDDVIPAQSKKPRASHFTETMAIVWSTSWQLMLLFILLIAAIVTHWIQYVRSFNALQVFDTNEL